MLRHPVLHQLQPPLGEGLQLHGGGEPQHTGNLTGRCRLRIDGHGQPQLTAHKPQLAAVFRAGERPTAAVCMDDALAIGLTGLLKGMGLDVPGDVSIVSFNNTDAGKYHIPALTSFEIDPYRLGMSAMHLMADVLKGAADAPRSIEVPFTLIERDSVAAAPASE